MVNIQLKHSSFTFFFASKKHQKNNSLDTFISNALDYTLHSISSKDIRKTMTAGQYCSQPRDVNTSNTSIQVFNIRFTQENKSQNILKIIPSIENANKNIYCK